MFDYRSRNPGVPLRARAPIFGKEEKTVSEEGPIEITSREYVYLTQSLKPLRAAHEEDAAPGFVLLKKRDNLKRLVRLVFQNELTESEQQVARRYFIERQTLSEIARELHASRRAVASDREAARKKLYVFLKYPFMMRFSLLCPPDDLFRDLREDLSENPKES